MLSPGKWHLRVPKDPILNLQFRLFVLRKCRDNPALQKAIIDICAQDFLFFVSVFIWQIDPKKKGSLGRPGPWISYEFQEAALLEMLWCVEHGRDLVIEKSRQMGASWMLILLFVWLWLFHDWQTLLFISRNEKAVEDESPNSLFWKIDFILSYLPDWMMRHWRERDHRRKLHFLNPDTNSAIFGEASTGQANVGGNTTAMGIDEFSQIKEDYEVLHRTSDSTECRIFNGTHLGLGTAFFELTQRVDMKKLVLHWSQHPVYSRGLYKLDHRGEIEILDKRFVFTPQCSKCSGLCDVEIGMPSDCCDVATQQFKFVRDGSPVGGPFPGLRSPWYDWQCRRKGDSRAVAMDLDINPSGSVRQFFNAIKIRDLVLRYSDKPLWEGRLEYDREAGVPVKLIEEVNGPIKMWIKPDAYGKPPPGKYALACDNSAGTGATPTCFSLGNCETKEKVLQYADPWMDAKSAAPFATALGLLFCDHDGQGAKICWELPGPGITFGNTIRELGYAFVYLRVTTDKYNKKRTESMGWASSPASKLALLEEYRHALENHVYMNRSEASLKDCLSYEHVNNSVEHQKHDATNDPSGARVNHGDQVMADAMTWMMMKGEAAGRKVTLEPEIRQGSLAWRRQLHDNAREQMDQWL